MQCDRPEPPGLQSQARSRARALSLSSESAEQQSADALMNEVLKHLWYWQAFLVDTVPSKLSLSLSTACKETMSKFRV